MTGAELKAARLALGYTQTALAALLGTSAPSLSRWEAAKRAEVPGEVAAAVQQLPKAPGGGRGPYRKEAAPSPRRKATRTAQAAPPGRAARRARARTPPAEKTPRQATQEATGQRTQGGQPAEEYLPPEAVGAVLLEEMQDQEARVAGLLRQHTQSWGRGAPAAEPQAPGRHTTKGAAR